MTSLDQLITTTINDHFCSINDNLSKNSFDQLITILDQLMTSLDQLEARNQNTAITAI